jgi:hypothetical protein
MKFNDARTILMNEWDPLDVGDNPHLSDEYDAYIPRVLQMIAEGSIAEDIARYLKKIEEDELGLIGDSPDDRRMSAALSLLNSFQA